MPIVHKVERICVGSCIEESGSDSVFGKQYTIEYTIFGVNIELEKSYVKTQIQLYTVGTKDWPQF